MQPAWWLGEIGFWSFLATASAAALFSRGKPGPAGRAAAWAAGAAGAAMLAGICLQIGRPPLSGALESLGYMAFLLALLALHARAGGPAMLRVASLLWWAVVVLLALLALLPRQVNPDWFIYQHFWTRSFFLCRVTALPLLLYSSLAALAWPGLAEGNEPRRVMMHRSRRYLLLGTAMFLVGEVSGFYWCLNWRGDYWLWNRNFLESTMIFLLASAALHLPPRLAANPKFLRLAYGLPGLLAMAAYLAHQATEAFL